MKQVLFLLVSILVIGASNAESVLELGFSMPSSPPVEWKEGIAVNMTCKAECKVPCDVCSLLKYKMDVRNKIYEPNQQYEDFKMFAIRNVTAPYVSKCSFEQTISILNIKSNESGTVRCISAKDTNRVGIGFLYIFHNVTSTNVTLPTEVTATNVEIESTGIKVSVKVRKFNTTVDGDNYPFVSCSATGSASTTFQWSRANGSKLGTELGIDTTVASEAKRVTSKMTFRSFIDKGALIVGEYKCSVEDNTARYAVVTSAPVVKMSEKDYRSSMEGDTVTQSCSVAAYPVAVVTWSKDNQTLVADGERISFGSDNATLTISSLKQEDAGLYICTAENSLGVGQAYIKLRVKDRLAALWPFLGILAEVIILVTIILLYEKKRAAQKRSQEEADAGAAAADGNQGERNANDSDVRQRPAVKT